MLNKPVWLMEQPEILALLNRFVDKLDKKPIEQWTHLPSIAVTERNLPGLFRLGEQADQIWMLIKSLCQDYQLISIRLDKKREPLDPEYFNARLRLRDSAETVLRSWLQRPRAPSLLQQWRDAVDSLRSQFPGNVDKLSARPLIFYGKTAQQVVQAIASINTYHDQCLTLRQLSAVCFWGQSKFLDGRLDLVLGLFPELKLNIRPVVVNVYLPRDYQGVLFIENQDSYTSAMQGVPEGVGDLALVYSAGFKSGARRIRHDGGVSLHFSGEGSLAGKDDFEQWWYQRRETNWPQWFWGDLDYAGMNILKQLKKRFPAIRSWQTGYQLMLQHLINGHAYQVNTQEKQYQLDPLATGCVFADNFLLTALRQYGGFVDQEVLS